MIQQQLFLICLFLVTLTGIAGAQTHPGNPSATYVDDFDGTVQISAAVKTDYVVIVFLMPDGSYDYVIDVQEFTFSADGCTGIGSIPLKNIVDAVADDAVEAGVGLGYPSCSMNAFEEDVDVWTISCATRSGSGCGTYFTNCGTGWCYRTYEVDCPGSGGPASIHRSGGTTSSCSSCSGSEGTCPTSGSLQ